MFSIQKDNHNDIDWDVCNVRLFNYDHRRVLGLHLRRCVPSKLGQSHTLPSITTSQSSTCKTDNTEGKGNQTKCILCMYMYM